MMNFWKGLVNILKMKFVTLKITPDKGKEITVRVPEIVFKSILVSHLFFKGDDTNDTIYLDGKDTCNFILNKLEKN